MKTLLAVLCAVLLGFTFAGSSSAASPTPTASVTATLLGQTGEDIVGTYTQAPDGIKDVHVRLTGVTSPLTSVKVTGADGIGNWQTPKHANWWLVAIIPQTDPSIVDLYFDPRTPESAYTLTVNYGGRNQTLLTVGSPPPPPVSMWTLTLSTFGTGTGTTTGAGVYANGTVVTLLATPAAGSTFNGWLGVAMCATGTVTMTANTTCTATFTLIPPPQWTLTIATAGTGSGATTGAGTYVNGTVVTMTATPATGSTFGGWTGTGCTTGTVTMTANASCTAVFTLSVSTPTVAQWTLTITKAGTGSGATTGAGTYVNGTVVTMTATPATGSTFGGWTGTGCTTGTVTMTANVGCTAVFTLSVSTPPAASPTITPSGGSYTGSVSVTMMATAGATIYYTMDGSTPAQTSTPYTGAMALTSSMTVKAKAFQSGYTPSAEADASFTVFAQPGANLPELPRVYVDTTYVPPTGNVITVQAGGNLQAAINAANLGDVIELQAGATYPGTITLPNKTSGTGWIIIRSSAWASLPPAGTRVGPQHTPLMAKITTNPTNLSWYAISTLQGAHHYRFIGIEVTGTDPPPGGQQYGLFVIDGSYYDASGVYQLQPTNALTPHHIVIDRCYIHGTPTGEFMRAVIMHGLYVAVVDSYLSNFHSAGSDSQAAIAWNTPGPLKLVNNYLEGAGENVMFGGAPSAVASYVPSDLEIRHNFFDKPLSWNPGDPSYAGITWSVKNLLEFKDGQRALIEANIFGHHWAQSQAGFFFIATPRGETNQNPWATTSDITFRYNRILKTTAGVAVSGTDGQVTQKSSRILFEHNVFENIGAYVVPGAFNGEFSLPTNAIQNLTIRHNTIFQSSTPLHFAGDSAGAMNGLSIVDNIFANMGYGIAGDTTGGVAELDAIAPGWVMQKNAIYGPYPNANGVPQSYYPAGDYFPASQTAVGFVNFAGGDYHLAASSLYKNAGSDGTDVGANIDTVNAATACVMSGIACGTP